MAQPGESVIEKDEMCRFMVECLQKLEPTDLTHFSWQKCWWRGTIETLQSWTQSIRRGQALHGLMGIIYSVPCRQLCMDVAIEKAKFAGVGWVTCKGSNHFGIAGWYSMRAMKHGMLGFACTNTSPIMYPTRAAKPALGTNPLSLAAPGVGGDAFVLDMATTTVAVGKIEIASRKEMPVPETWGVAQGGVPSTDPNQIIHGGGLLPLGGTEFAGGYKGYGMAALVEIFCGILGGAHWGPNVRKWMSATSDADLGQCFIAIDPDAFAPGFGERMQQFMETMRGLPQAEEGVAVEVAGDMEKRHEMLCDKLGGIPYHPNQITFANNLAASLGIAGVKQKN